MIARRPDTPPKDRRDRNGEADPRALWAMGRSHLEALRTERGFLASEETGLYPAFYGRDSLWILLFLLAATEWRRGPAFTAWVQEAGRAILRSLGELRGTMVDDRVEEQPGKVIHEYHERPSAHALRMMVPLRGGRSFAGFDETFLFVVAFRRFAERFPRDPLVTEEWPAVEAALDWIDRDGDEDGDGLYEYRRRNPDNLLNEIWKDSYDSITVNGFDVPRHPVAWIESQAYAFRALNDAAAMLEKRREDGWARRLQERAMRIQELVDRSYWLKEEGCLAIALDGMKRAIPLAASDAGHALWAGLVRDDRVGPLVERMLRPDLFTPFGLRTLSSHSPYYAPFAYHRGAIWPFDNAVFAMGLLRVGKELEARLVMHAVGRAILGLRSPVEAYVVLDPQGIVEPAECRAPILAHRHLVTQPDSEERAPVNRNQAWSAAALVYFAVVLANMEGVALDDE